MTIMFTPKLSLLYCKQNLMHYLTSFVLNYTSQRKLFIFIKKKSYYLIIIHFNKSIFLIEVN